MGYRLSRHDAVHRQEQRHASYTRWGTVKRLNGKAAEPPADSISEPPQPQPRVLVIAGSDPSGGAGLQADLKVLLALDVYATSVITALTVQDTARVHEVLPVDPWFVERQLEIVLDDVGADAIKIGMLARRDTVELVARVCQSKARGIPIVLDPVLVSSSGHELLEVSGHTTLIRRLMPLCALVTPNAPEAELITGIPVREEAHLHQAADQLLMMGQSAVLITGGHLPGDRVVDLLRTADGLERRFEAPRLPDTPHGTGCALASAIAAGLGHGYTLENAVERAHDFVQEAIARATRVGRGRRCLHVGVGAPVS
jgi:hydroxymethylpyrimidine/phosphomethylpyrimidine kinase